MLALTPPIPVRAWSMDWRILYRSKLVGTAHETWRLAPDDSGEDLVTDTIVAGAKHSRYESRMLRIIGPGGKTRREDLTTRNEGRVRRSTAEFKNGEALVHVTEPGMRGNYVIDAPAEIPFRVVTPRFIEETFRTGKPIRNAAFSLQYGRWGTARVTPGKAQGSAGMLLFDFPGKRDVLTFDTDFRVTSRKGSDGYEWIRTGVHEGP